MEPLQKYCTFKQLLGISTFVVFVLYIHIQQLQSMASKSKDRSKHAAGSRQQRTHHPHQTSSLAFKLPIEL